MKISYDDEQNLYRLLDGELPPEQAAALRARIDAEPPLRAEFEERQRLSGALSTAANARGFAAPAGFTASVLGATRRLPGRREIEEQEASDTLVRACRRILIAAVVVVGFGFVWHSGLVRSNRDTRIEATPNEVKQEVERLDALGETDQSGERKTK